MISIKQISNKKKKIVEEITGVISALSVFNIGHFFKKKSHKTRMFQH